MEEIDIWRSAQALIKSHGDGAAMEAAHQADKLRQRNDHEGHAVWMRILAAIQELQNERSKDGKTN